jgi:cytochrome P450
LPASSFAAVSPVLLRHDPRWYPDPETFTPGGGSANAVRPPPEARLPARQYRPARACTGEQFAWAEVITVLAVLARSRTIRTDPGLRPALQYRVTLRRSQACP